MATSKDAVPTIEFNDYRDFLKAVLRERVRRNPSYSLRAMARQIRVGQAQLTEVLKGKKRFSVTKASQIMEALALDDRDGEHFMRLVVLDSIKDAASREAYRTRMMRAEPQMRGMDESSLNVQSNAASNAPGAGASSAAIST